jgi:hypothetical protein
MEFTWPLCAKCGRGVEKIERRIDYWNGDLLYFITCHGQVCMQRVTGLDLHDVILIAVTSHFDEKPTSAYPSVTYEQTS